MFKSLATIRGYLCSSPAATDSYMATLIRNMPCEPCRRLLHRYHARRPLSAHTGNRCQYMKWVEAAEVKLRANLPAIGSASNTHGEPHRAGGLSLDVHDLWLVPMPGRRRGSQHGSARGSQSDSVEDPGSPLQQVPAISVILAPQPDPLSDRVERWRQTIPRAPRRRRAYTVPVPLIRHSGKQ